MIRDKDGQLRKMNPEVTANIENEIAIYKRGLERAMKTRTLKEDERWINVKQMIEEKIKQTDRELDNFDKNENRKNDLNLQKRMNYKMFISMVEDVDLSIENFERMIEIKQKELDGRRKEPASV